MQPVRTCQVCGDVNVMSTNTLCVSCHRTLYPGELDSRVRAAALRLGLVAAILFALFLFTPTTHAAPYTPTAPVGCTITGTSGEGFPVATCENGDEMYLDLDGSIDRAPGTWVLTK